MLTQSTLRRLGALALVTGALVLAAACSSDNSVSKAQYAKLAAEIKRILDYAITRGGTTLRDFISPDDVELVSVTSDPAEAVRIVVDCYEQRCAENPAAPEKADAQ